MSTEWLSLLEYSNKYSVSISTLRRRIKSHSVHYKTDDGKYFLMDEPIMGSSVGRKLGTNKAALKKAADTKKSKSDGNPKRSLNAAQDSSSTKEGNQNINFSAANMLLDELKKAYKQVLHEKEEQIHQLKEEVADLKTLVRVLESENARYRDSI